MHQGSDFSVVVFGFFCDCIRICNSFVFVFVFELGDGSWGSKEMDNTTQVKKTKVLGGGGGSDLEEERRGNENIVFFLLSQKIGGSDLEEKRKQEFVFFSIGPKNWWL